VGKFIAPEFEIAERVDFAEGGRLQDFGKVLDTARCDTRAGERSHEVNEGRWEDAMGLGPEEMERLRDITVGSENVIGPKAEDDKLDVFEGPFLVGEGVRCNPGAESTSAENVDIFADLLCLDR
jgi:hypothetical protein